MKPVFKVAVATSCRHIRVERWGGNVITGLHVLVVYSFFPCQVNLVASVINWYWVIGS